MTLYRAPRLQGSGPGALVFAAGTVQWSWGLEGDPDGIESPDVDMQQATVNLFADMGVQPTTLIPNLVPATQTTDTTPASSVITSPASGASVVQNSTVVIMGTASDANGQVGGVEISTDGGATWHAATGRGNWSYQWTPLAVDTYNIRSRAVDDSANLETPGSGISINVTPRSCPCSIWPANAVPTITDDPDTASSEAGVKFRADVDGKITGIRFFKTVGNSGTHTGSLWTANGIRLASATFVNESASGWQQVNFASPVSITADTTYVASFHSNGHYAVDIDYFRYDQFANTPLRALKDGFDGPNGLYVYGSQTAFPNLTFKSANYWIDVVFTQGSDVTPPTVISRTPGPGANGVSVNTAVQVTFSEPVQSSTIVFALKDPANNTVPATVTFPSGSTATLTPNAPLVASTQYTAFVSGAKDPAGNTMSAINWSFTTAGPANCPCSIWPSNATPAVIADPDTRASEAGVKFRSSVSGFITAIRFYKASTNTGTHIAHLWNNSNGALLATATFTNETGSGWQQVNFPTGVPISANTTYVASYHHNNGHYSVNANYFANSGVDSGPLHALRNGEVGGNGVYVSGSSGFPSLSYQASNYWIDVVFATSPGSPDTTRPTVIAQFPAANATGTPRAADVDVTFSEAVQPSTIVFTLKNPAGATVAAAVTWDPLDNTVSLNPNSNLAANTKYTATISGATDLSGNVMAAPVTFSFKTGP